MSLLGEDAWEQAVQLPWVGGAAALHQLRDGWMFALKAAMLTRQNFLSQGTLFLPSVQSDFPLHFTHPHRHVLYFPLGRLCPGLSLTALYWSVFLQGHYFLPLQSEALLVFSGRPQDCGLLLSVAAAAVPLEQGFLVSTQP